MRKWRPCRCRRAPVALIVGVLVLALLSMTPRLRRAVAASRRRRRGAVLALPRRALLRHGRRRPTPPLSSRRPVSDSKMRSRVRVRDLRGHGRARRRAGVAGGTPRRRSPGRAPRRSSGSTEELQAAFDRASEAEAARRNEQLKAALLDALTHNLRTPLTADQGGGDGADRGRQGARVLRAPYRRPPRAPAGDRRGIRSPEPIHRGALDARSRQAVSSRRLRAIDLDDIVEPRPARGDRHARASRARLLQDRSRRFRSTRPRSSK